VGHSWWNCEGEVWGTVGGIVKVMCGAELVELRRRCGSSALIFKQLNIFQAFLYISTRTSVTSGLVYDATSQVRDFRKLCVESSMSFPSCKHYKQRQDWEG